MPLRLVLILPNELSKLGERAHYRNLIFIVGGFEPNLNKKYDEFSARPENTQSYILKLTTGIIINIIIYIFRAVERIVCSM